MSRSSASNANRGQLQPLPALVAVLVLTLALTAYADVTRSLPDRAEPTPAVPALKRIQANATTGAILEPDRLSPAASDLDGYRVNVTLRVGGHQQSVGPSPSTDATGTTATRDAIEASTRVAVAWDDRVRPGVLRVEVWPWTAA